MLGPSFARGSSEEEEAPARLPALLDSPRRGTEEGARGVPVRRKCFATLLGSQADEEGEARATSPPPGMNLGRSCPAPAPLPDFAEEEEEAGGDGRRTKRRRCRGATARRGFRERQGVVRRRAGEPAGEGGAVSF